MALPNLDRFEDIRNRLQALAEELRQYSREAPKLEPKEYDNICNGVRWINGADDYLRRARDGRF